MKLLLQSIRTVLVLTVLTGLAYPLLVTLGAQLCFRDAANGSLIIEEGKVRGSALIAQHVDDPRFFWPRPSAADYATVASGASNKGPTSADLLKSISERKERVGPNAPVELLTASGSGLDPHLSPAAAKYQAPRIAAARNVPVEQIAALIDRLTEPPQLGLLGEPRVNVLRLNRTLDALK